MGVVLQFQASWCVIPFMIQRDLMLIARLFASKSVVISGKSGGNLMLIAVISCVILAYILFQNT